MPSPDDPAAALPPFDPARAFAARQQLGLTLGQVAWAVAAYRGGPMHPDTLQAWESGTAVPDEEDVKGLAAALWCSPVALVGEPATLAQCRTVAGLSPGETATRLGMTRARWEEAERRNRWQGTAAQTGALLRVLRPPPSCFVAACGRTPQLKVLLREAVASWWPNYVGPVTRIVPLDPAAVRAALERLHLAYQRLEHAAGGPPRAAAAAEARTDAFLEHIDLHLWQELRATAGPVQPNQGRHTS
ncbi:MULTISPECIES: helix-turn-helix domain-containing protein [Streptomyces]|uniref:helix-turn-helix domain-containing protein n=1 Tax=Streptomyces TaxID=1883 RepID=UPI000F7AC650|nr:MULTISPECIES: helix-turn-helix transcriptional regulator [Streptomyces]RST08717.1 XRE family transcriptional regulator [Streptomyces sp. WAC07149]GLX19848.1 DNA-binding protein [Streptomyces lavendulae subsp. lavendulae]GLX27344.1 DNA-binding protein [Streptomyces lavendulae subsp. lavendulae]